MDLISLLENKIYAGENISFYEAVKLTQINNEYINELFIAADRIRDKFNGNIVNLCSIINAKCGSCSEDCKFCAQSAHYKTNIEEHEIVSIDEVLDLAKENQHCGVNRFSLVTSGRETKGRDFQKVIKIYEKLKNEVNMELCASLGILDYEQLLTLKETGVNMYHHNLETSRDYYKKICTTHSYDERIETINNVKKAGLQVCSGGIIGMGEDMGDRIKLAIQLRELEVTSIPINILNPIKGTPLENMKRLSEEEILKTVAIFRFINPRAYIRLAGGRNLIKDFGRKCFRVGANATISGNYLTTSGNKISDDIEMIKELGFEVRRND
ncbi:biotin synthase BioB [Clostridium lundense]|uniref:biotin synthase BioB n=1 Tax=Clostridium lundense TaxID=319475 RepID=UPI000488F32B|nr:biotin synthase BioB [Clostridium lundense]